MIFFPLPLFSHKFLLKDFLLYFCLICYLKWCIKIFCFKYFTSYPCFYFLPTFMLYKKEATIFQIYSTKICHKVHTFFYKIFEGFNNDLYLWESEVTTIKKGSISSISHIFQKNFLTEPHTYLYNTLLCKSLDFLISCFESGHIF